MGPECWTLVADWQRSLGQITLDVMCLGFSSVNTADDGTYSMEVEDIVNLLKALKTVPAAYEPLTVR